MWGRARLAGALARVYVGSAAQGGSRRAGLSSPRRGEDLPRAMPLVCSVPGEVGRRGTIAEEIDPMTQMSNAEGFGAEE
jgi:hypothetical protein